ncbi:MAG: hypothetical protein ACREKL_14405 [Chthoniobacterales bacterium]
MKRRRAPLWRRLFPLGAVAVFGVLQANGMTFFRGSKEPMQVVIGVALTFVAVIFSALALLMIADLFAKRRARGGRLRQ